MKKLLPLLLCIFLMSCSREEEVTVIFNYSAAIRENFTIFLIKSCPFIVNKCSESIGVAKEISDGSNQTLKVKIRSHKVYFYMKGAVITGKVKLFLNEKQCGEKNIQSFGSLDEFLVECKFKSS
jgi:hypothetical protein